MNISIRLGAGVRQRRRRRRERPARLQLAREQPGRCSRGRSSVAPALLAEPVDELRRSRRGGRRRARARPASPATARARRRSGSPGRRRPWRRSAPRCASSESRTSSRSSSSSRVPRSRCPGRVRGAGWRPARGCASSLARMQVSLEPVRLLRVEPPVARVEPGDARRGLEVSIEGRAQLGGDPHDLLADDRSASSRSSTGSRSRTPCTRSRSATVAVTSGVTNGLPSRSPPIHEPKVSGRAVGRQVHPDLGQQRRSVLQHVRQRAGGQPVEVVQRTACLVQDLGALEAQLVGLPQQLDELGEPAGRVRVVQRRALGGSSVPIASASPRSLSSTDRRAASVGCAVNTGRAASRPTPSRTSPGSSSPASSAAAIRRTARASGPPSLRWTARRSRLRCTCSVTLARWKYVENARASLIAVAQVDADEELLGGLGGVGRGAVRRTCSTRSSSSGPSWRTRVCPSRSPEPADVGAQRCCHRRRTGRSRRGRRVSWARESTLTSRLSGPAAAGRARGGARRRRRRAGPRG